MSQGRCEPFEDHGERPAAPRRPHRLRGARRATFQMGSRWISEDGAVSRTVTHSVESTSSPGRHPPETGQPRARVCPLCRLARRKTRSLKQTRYGRLRRRRDSNPSTDTVCERRPRRPRGCHPRPSSADNTTQTHRKKYLHGENCGAAVMAAGQTACEERGDRGNKKKIKGYNKQRDR